MTDDDLKTIPGWDTLTAAGEVHPASPETLARAQHAVQKATAGRRRRPMLPVLSAAAVVAAVAVIGTLVVEPFGDDPPVAGDQPTPAVSRPTASAPRYLDGGAVSSSCAYSYTPQQLKKQPFAFDGTVVSIARPGTAYPNYLRQDYSVVTFKVGEWFKSAGGTQTHVLLQGTIPPGPDNDYVDGFPYTVGSRLLITGAVLDNISSSLVNEIAWNCHFSRFYDVASAREWREALAK